MDNIDLSTEQKIILDKAVKLLNPFFCNDEGQERQGWVYYFQKKDGEEFGSEYDCCSSNSCIKKAKEEIREHYGKYTRITEHSTMTGNDCEDIPRCCICGKPFEEYITYIDQEFDNYESNVPSYEDLVKYTNISFDITAIFNSVPSCDNQISPYDKHQLSLGNDKPINDVIQMQKDLITRVVNYAILITNIIENHNVQN